MSLFVKFLYLINSDLILFSSGEGEIFLYIMVVTVVNNIFFIEKKKAMLFSY